MAWGGELNARKFHERIEERWEADSSFCNEVYYKKAVALSMMYSRIKKLVSDAKWYQDKKGNLAQIVAYTFSKLVHAVEADGKEIDLMAIWSGQEVPECFDEDVLHIARLVFDEFYDPASPHTDVREYCKSNNCWETISELDYELTDNIEAGLKVKE